MGYFSIRGYEAIAYLIRIAPIGKSNYWHRWPSVLMFSFRSITSLQSSHWSWLSHRWIQANRQSHVFTHHPIREGNSQTIRRPENASKNRFSYVRFKAATRLRLPSVSQPSAGLPWSRKIEASAWKKTKNSPSFTVCQEVPLPRQTQVRPQEGADSCDNRYVTWQCDQASKDPARRGSGGVYCRRRACQCAVFEEDCNRPLSRVFCDCP